jgi:hypothetical protein
VEPTGLWRRVVFVIARDVV